MVCGFLNRSGVGHLYRQKMCFWTSPEHGDVDEKYTCSAPPSHLVAHGWNVHDDYVWEIQPNPRHLSLKGVGVYSGEDGPQGIEIRFIVR